MSAQRRVHPRCNHAQGVTHHFVGWRAPTNLVVVVNIVVQCEGGLAAGYFDRLIKALVKACDTRSPAHLGRRIAFAAPARR